MAAPYFCFPTPSGGCGRVRRGARAGQVRSAKERTACCRPRPHPQRHPRRRAKDGDSRRSDRERPPTAADIGLTRKDFYEARVIRRPRGAQRSRSSIGCYSPVWGFLAIRSPVWGFLAPSPCAFPEPVGPLSLEPGASAPFCGPPNQSPR